MIEVDLEDVIVRILASDAGEDVPRLANRNLRIVLLRERGGERLLPIWIGAFEGDALALTRGGADVPRPLTPDLLARVVDALGSHVLRVVVTRLENHTFYASVVLEGRDGETELDARPSDAINLAARTGAQILVAREVMESSGCTPDRLDDELARIPPDEEGPGEWRSLSASLVQALWPKPC
jgi:bifunctional DNase/RNase